MVLLPIALRPMTHCLPPLLGEGLLRENRLPLTPLLRKGLLRESPSPKATSRISKTLSLQMTQITPAVPCLESLMIPVLMMCLQFGNVNRQAGLWTEVVV